MIETKTRHEKYVLVAVYDRDEEKALALLSELALLTDTAGGECVCKVIQHLENPNPASYIGKGKAEEISVLIDELGADGVICDDELTAVQIRNLSDILNVKVIDRTILILDIFAAHAMTSEGKLQVEMAQLEYRASHLAGIGKALSRLGGGIGTRGPGETKLETDKRAIRRRISSFRSEIKRLKESRNTGRQKRTQSGIPVAAIVGYTNAGKSTLLNRVTNAGVKEEDRLFATLDPTTRLCSLPDGMEVLLTDTVGFISKLPHNLIDAFRSTLEEAKYADIIIHVVDASDPELDMHMDVVYQTLSDLGITGKPVITVFNKMDMVNDED
ncbi:MAG: GTPase HflX, partial [Lachnospiraceae bacterium]|nr:GTPase HflX [Lachnospiraceae bacterium]